MPVVIKVQSLGKTKEGTSEIVNESIEVPGKVTFTADESDIEPNSHNVVVCVSGDEVSPQESDGTKVIKSITSEDLNSIKFNFRDLPKNPTYILGRMVKTRRQA